MKTSVIPNFGFAKKARLSQFPHNFSRGIQKSRSREPWTMSWGSYEKTYLQLNPAPTDFKGPANFICYGQNSVIANKENKRK